MNKYSIPTQTLWRLIPHTFDTSHELRLIKQNTQCKDLFSAFLVFYRSYRCFELENINFRKMQSGAEKSQHKGSIMRWPGDPVTMACYGEGSGSQARWHFSNRKISKGVRERERQRVEKKQKGHLPFADCRILPHRQISSHTMSLWTAAAFMRCNMRSCWSFSYRSVAGKGREEGHIHKAHNRELGLRLDSIYLFAPLLF